MTAKCVDALPRPAPTKSLDCLLKKNFFAYFGLNFYLKSCV